MRSARPRNAWLSFPIELGPVGTGAALEEVLSCVDEDEWVEEVLVDVGEGAHARAGTLAGRGRG